MMIINTENLVSFLGASGYFSKVARLAGERGAVVILKGDIPRYALLGCNRPRQAL
jgi:hypothetical protein